MGNVHWGDIVTGRTRPVYVAATLIALVLVATGVQPLSAQWPAGTTNAVLSFIDAAGGHVTVLRHWHGMGGQDVQVYPLTPYFWDSCLPGQGAIMILLATPVGYPAPGLTSSQEYTSRVVAQMGQWIAQNLQSAPQAQGSQQLRRIIEGLVTPGDPAYEAIKSAIGFVNSLSAYEDYGYATFLMIKWEWRFPFPGCYPTVVTVPDGYGIPYVN